MKNRQHLRFAPSVKRLRFALSVVAILMTVVLTGAQATAEPEKMDVETHRFLIEKLEAVISATPKGDVTRVPALLRLADLFSEEARLLMMTEVEKGCIQSPKDAKEMAGCGVSNGDRRNAIKYYEMALNESSNALQSRILFQLAYLYEQNNESKKAAALYTKILSLGSKHFSKVVLGQSQAGLGEIAFKDKKFKEAKKAFELALVNKETPRRGWVVYRIAWSELNLGQAETGKQRLLQILKTPSLLTMESTEGAKIDASFQEDVARDLTVFFAKTGFSEKDIDSLWNLSPLHARKSILMDLAEEAERTGQKRAAIAVWSKLANQPIDRKNKDNALVGRERIEAQTRVATLRFGLGEKAKAVTDFKQVMLLWKKNSCEPEAECALLQKRLRKLVIDWNKNEETNLSRELLSMYTIYAAQFQDDSEMAFWGANVARELKANREASILYHQAAEEAAKTLSGPKKELAKDEKQTAQIRTVFEGSLLAEIEMAELAKDSKLRDQAYNHYLALNASGPKALEVKYQQAHVQYDAGQTAKAADMFYAIAAREDVCRAKSAPALCRQAADLALDSIVIVKNDERLEATATEFAAIYASGGSKDFSAIARRARLNIAAKAANGSSTSAMNENLKKLTDSNLKDASREDVLLTHQNRFVLAEKTRNFAAASAAAVAIINFKGATDAEREDAMAKRLWVAEMQLDFPTAYVTAKQMKMAKVKPAERELKLALLAELSGRDARPHLTKFIALTHDRKAELAARVKLIKASNYALAEFNRHFAAISKDSELLASVGLDVYARHPAPKLAKQLLAVRGVAKMPEGAVLVRAGEMKAIESWAKKLSQMKLPVGASDKTLQKSLASRVKTLSEADIFANKQIKSQDGWLQALALQTVAVENRRLKNEIMALPIPKGLKANDAHRYNVLIAHQVAPFEIKAIKIDQKLAKFWADQPAERFARAIEQSTGPKRSLFIKEAKSMIAVLNILSAAKGPAAAAERLTQAVNSETPEVRPASLASAREDVRQNPFDVESLKHLRSLEAEAGRDTMVTYLDSRMTRLGVGK